MFSGRFIVGLSVGWTSLCVNVRTTIWVFTLERLKFYDVGSLDDFIGLIFCNFTLTLCAYEFDNFSWIRRPQNPQKFEPHKN